MDADDALGALIFDVLRTASALDQAGAALVVPLGLTPARWQVLATLAHLGAPETVAGLARRLSLTRQSVQRVVDDLVAEGLVAMADNPADRRARLAHPTDAGRALAHQAEALRRPWTADLARGLDPRGVEAARDLLSTLRARLGQAEFSKTPPRSL